MEIISNPMRDSSAGGVFTLDAVEAARSALARWPSYSITPFLSLGPLASQLKLGEVWFKHEGTRFDTGSFKSLGAAYALESFLEKENSVYKPSKRSPLTVACASDGNYGRAVAWASRQLGCDCVVYLPEHVTEFRANAIRQFGARTVRVSGNYDAAEAAVKRDAIQHDWVLFSDSSDDNYTVIPRDVMAAYCVMLSEIGDSMPLANFTHVFLQCGVGAFAGAICDYLHSALGPKTPILVSVEPVHAACVFASVQQRRLAMVGGELKTIMAGLACGRPSPLAWELLRTQLDFCTTLDDSWAKQAVRLLAKGEASGEPIIAGETGAAGLGGLLCASSVEQWRRQLGLTSSSRILLFGTEGATDPGVHSSIIRDSANPLLNHPASEVSRYAAYSGRAPAEI